MFTNINTLNLLDDYIYFSLFNSCSDFVASKIYGLSVSLSKVGGFLRALQLPLQVQNGHPEIAQKRHLKVALKHQQSIDF